MYAARQTGASILEIEGTRDALERGISKRTACVLYMAGAHLAEGALPIEVVIEIAHGRGIPVIVDAAAQIPPISSLWHFTEELGADAAIFSGGKGLRGPQPSGLVVGRFEHPSTGVARTGVQTMRFGRPMKVGKEELVGLLAAVEWALEQDEPSVIAGYEASVDRWVHGLAGLAGVRAERGYPSEAGQPHGRAIVHFGLRSRLQRDEVVAALWDGDPRIAVSPFRDDAIALNPQTLEQGEDEVVLDALQRISAPEAEWRARRGRRGRSPAE